MKKSAHIFVAMGFVCILMSVVPSSALGQEVLDGVVEDFANSKNAWWLTLAPMASRLFGLLAGIELIISGIIYGLRRGEMDDIIGRLFIKFMIIAFMYAVLLNGSVWLPALIGGFGEIGERLSGEELSPSAIIALGVKMYMDVTAAGLGLNIIFNSAQVAMVVFTGIAIFIAFALVAMRLVLITVESIIVVTLGGLFIGFAASRVTASFADAYLVYAVAVGIKALVLTLVVAVGMTLAETWSDALSGMTLLDFSRPMQVLVGAATFAALSWYLPGVAADRLTQNVSFGIRDGLSTY